MRHRRTPLRAPNCRLPGRKPATRKTKQARRPEKRLPTHRAGRRFPRNRATNHLPRNPSTIPPLADPPTRPRPLRKDSPSESPPASEGNQVDPPGEIETTALPARSRPVPDDRGPTQENPPAEAEEPDPIPRVLLRAVNDSWIEIRSGDTSLVYSGLLREGESYAVPERRGLTMVTGNAGGLDVLVDGEAIPRLGPPGAVKRDISLDPDNLRGQAVP